MGGGRWRTTFLKPSLPSFASYPTRYTSGRRTETYSPSSIVCGKISTASRRLSHTCELTTCSSSFDTPIQNGIMECPMRYGAMVGSHMYSKNWSTESDLTTTERQPKIRPFRRPDGDHGTGAVIGWPHKGRVRFSDVPLNPAISPWRGHL